MILKNMCDRETELKSFIQEIFNKISIAVAIAVLRSKPENVTTLEHVRDVQNRVLKEWQKNQKPDIFEDKLVSIQFNKAAQDFADVLPDSPAVESDDSPIDPTCAKHLLDNLPEYCSPSPIPSETAIEEHGSYFQSLVQLKFAVETRKTVPFNSVRDFIIDGTRSHCGSVKQNILRFGSPRISPVSQDSGVLSITANGPKGPTSVSSSLFRSITHSANTEVLLTKGSQSLVNYVRCAVFNSPFDSYYRWKGSLLEKTCKILARSSIDSQCQTVISSFMKSSLDQMWMIDDVIKSFAVEHQLIILSTLCVVDEVCKIALNNVMSKFEEFIAIFPSNEPPPRTEIHKLDKIPHFLRFAEILFACWKRRVEAKLKTNKDMNTSSSSFAALWGLEPGLEDSPLDKNEVLLNSWRTTLEKLSFSCVEFHPLINSHLLKTLAAINSLVGSMEPQEESTVFFDTVSDPTS